MGKNNNNVRTASKSNMHIEFEFYFVEHERFKGAARSICIMHKVNSHGSYRIITTDKRMVFAKKKSSDRPNILFLLQEIVQNQTESKKVWELTVTFALL